jgi:hypothetical protein
MPGALALLCDLKIGGRQVINAIGRLFKTRKLAVLALLFCLCCQAKDKNKTADTNELVSGIISWGDPVLNSKGATVELRPVRKGYNNGVHESVYDISVSGVPRDQSYAVFEIPIHTNEPSDISREVYITADGRLCKREGLCHDDSGPYLRLSFISARGEPHRIALISEDSKYKITAMVIPNAIVTTDQGCRVEVVRATPRFELAIVRGEGFTPNEAFKYKSNSAGEVLEKKIQVDADGKFVFALAPNVKGKIQGDDKVVFKAEKCSPEISYHWGAIDY